MTVASFGWSRHLIANSGADAEQQLVAAIIAGARESCAAGNADDCKWLGACAGAYLSLICPANIDEREVLERLLASLPMLDDPDEGWRENAATFIQVCLNLSFASGETEMRHDDALDLPTVRPRTRDPTQRHPDRRVAQTSMSGL